MRKDFNTFTIIAIILIITFIGVFFVIMPNMPHSSTSLRIGDGVFRARVAYTQDDREKGLSGVTNMSADQALLMVYPDSGKWGIWMKDMKIPIDIIWLDQDKKVVFIVKNAYPDEENLRTYVTKMPAKYVIELPAGTVDSRAIKFDSVATFHIDEGGVK